MSNNLHVNFPEMFHAITTHLKKIKATSKWSNRKYLCTGFHKPQETIQVNIQHCLVLNMSLKCWNFERIGETSIGAFSAHADSCGELQHFVFYPDSEETYENTTKCTNEINYNKSQTCSLLQYNVCMSHHHFHMAFRVIQIHPYLFTLAVPTYPSSSRFSARYTWKVNKSYGRDNDAHDNMVARRCVSDNSTEELHQSYFNFHSGHRSFGEKITNIGSAQCTHSQTVFTLHSSFFPLECATISVFFKFRKAGRFLTMLYHLFMATTEAHYLY